MRVQPWRQLQRCRCLLSVSLLGLLGGFSPAWAASTVITALQEAVLQGPTIRLGDVAQVQSDDAELVARIQRVVLGQTPRLGVMRWLSRNTMLIRLRHQGLMVQELEFQGPKQVRVSRAAQRLPLSELEATVRQALSQHVQRTAPTLSLRDIRGLESVSVSPGPVHYEVLTPSRAPRAGALTFTLAIEVAGKVERQLRGRAFLYRLQEAASEAPGAAGDTASRHASSSPSRAARDDLAPTPVVKSPARKMPLLIRRGDVVQIVSESALVKVSTPGEALQSGRAGDTIRVRNTSSKREIKARVIDQHTVRVLL